MEKPKLTRNQQLVLAQLVDADSAQSAYDILNNLRDDGIKAPLQVYRALEKLLDAGLAHRLESVNGFVACAEPHCHAHGSVAFAICEDCGHVAEFADDVVRQRLDAWTQKEGFVPSRTNVELRGLCAKCKAA